MASSEPNSYRYGTRDANYVLSGLIKMHDCYLGALCSGGKRGRCKDKAKVVVVLFKADKDIPLFAHMQVVEDLKIETLQKFVDRHLGNGADVQCNGYSSYMGVRGANCHGKVFDTASGNLKWLHKSISNLKVLFIGTYHGRHYGFQPYLDDFSFQLKRRDAAN